MNVLGNGAPPSSATRVILTPPTCQRMNLAPPIFNL